MHDGSHNPRDTHPPMFGIVDDLIDVDDPRERAILESINARLGSVSIILPPHTVPGGQA